ncbi:KilA-N domain-containing protein [Xenorhabdus sp. XENO-7]|uniref:KilA-N domain-containing protein n=1 Tax=Xenorhabdus aichiensis TaxID=3025874 RepID=A0ABT5M8V5_9GAMM|nr:KilA-N domain-containing protein [Xenorhabdus aichiensis]MDC9623916.1 KilA-N domain-containing protein [Xenorhabdus aichiensis]
MNIANNNLPVIAGVEITTDSEGRFNLNALHKASGEGASKTPSQWLRFSQAKELIAELESNLLKNSQSVNSHSGHKVVNVVNGGAIPGTFAHELIAVSYAGWISPSFQLQVNQTFIDYRSGKLVDQPQLSEMEMIAAIASNAARNEKRISAVEQDVEQIKQGTIPQGYQGYSYLQATYGLSNAKSKQLVMAWSVPHKKVPHVAPGGQVTQMSVVYEESFEKALHQMMKEAEQRGSQWSHPKMGRFSITGWKVAA